MAESRELQILLTLKDNATSSLKNLNSSIENTQKSFRDNFGAIADQLSNIGQKMTIVGAAATAGFGLAVNEAVKLNESVNAVSVVFGEGADGILAFGQNAATAVGLSNSEFNQMATITGALFSDVGKPMDEVADITIELTRRASDLASVFNTDVSDAMNAINAAVRGETEAIRRYAGDVTDATLEQYLLAKGMSGTVSEMTQQEKRLLRMTVLLDQTSAVAGDFTNTSDQLANSQRIVTAQIKDMSTKIGTVLLPILTEVLAKVGPIITKMAEWIEANPELSEKIIILVAALGGLMAVLGPILMVLPGIVAAIGILSGPVGVIVLAIGALVAVGSLLYLNWSNIKKAASRDWNIIKNVVSTAIGTISNTFSKIKGVVTKVVGVLKTLWDWFSFGVSEGDFLNDSLTHLPDALQGLFTGVANFITNVQSVWESFKEGTIATFTAISNFISAVFTTAFGVAMKVLQFLFMFTIGVWITIFNAFGIDIVQVVIDAVAKIKELWEAMTSWVTEKWTSLTSSVSENTSSFIDTMSGYWESLTTFITSLWESFTTFFNEKMNQISMFFMEIWTAISEFIGVIWTTIYSYISERLASIYERVLAFITPVQNAFSSLWSAVAGTAASAFEAVKETIKSGLNWIIEKINYFIRRANEIARAASSVPGISAGDIPQLPEIPMLAKGGIVNRPTLAMIGEAGPEAVVPLSRGGAGIGGVNITINGDVTGQEIIEKVKQGLIRDFALNQRIPT